MTSYDAAAADATMQRELSARIRASLLHGDQHVRRIALNLLLALNDIDLNVAELIGMRTPAIGEPQQADGRLDRALTVIARCAWEMSVQSQPQLRTWARDITQQLDGVGANVDDRVTAQSERVGFGPELFDVDGLRYRLTRQYVDVHGKRWEHSGDWAEETPVMRIDEPGGHAMTLPAVISEYGPLFAIRSPEAAPGALADDPPF